MSELDAVVDLAAGAEDSPLATELAARIRANIIHDPRKRAAFMRLGTSVLLSAEDAAESVTLQFDRGHLTIYDDNIGVPAITLCGDAALLHRLCHLHLSYGRPLPGILHRTQPGRTFRGFWGALARREVRVYGALLHLRTLLRFLWVIAAHD